MKGLEEARRFIDLGAQLVDAPDMGEEQLQGAVALKSILEQHGVAYLADEVGMGKTFVALALVALCRHEDPNFRVLVIAPRKNIQEAWQKKFESVVEHNVRYADMRVKGLDGAPVRTGVQCQNLAELLRETSLDADRDFYCRMTSFSFGLSEDRNAWRAKGEELRGALPWADPSLFKTRTKQEMKDNFAKLVCCGLPTFDLVIVDEAHNLKAGFQKNVAARNRVMALALGRAEDDLDTKLFPGYGPRAKRVLFLSATPVEQDYYQLYNQLDVLGHARAFSQLGDSGRSREEKHDCAKKILIRRVRRMKVHDKDLTKNMYRRQWSHGGVEAHDLPIEVRDPRQRLAVALVQKKVSEILGNERFGSRFQIGMLASFESFLQTSGVKIDPDGEEGSGSNFDDADQTDDPSEREGVDVHAVNRLARDYREKFGEELPHPKMDSLVEHLSHAWQTGEKALVFVRRVASVKELKRKLDERYNPWLKNRMSEELAHPDAGTAAVLRQRFEELYREFESARRRRLRVSDETGADESTPQDLASAGNATYDDLPADRGDAETFFAWFFRGDGPKEVMSGAALQRRFIQPGAVYSTFFEDNHVMWLLNVGPGNVLQRLSQVLNLSEEDCRRSVQEQAAHYVTDKTWKRRLARYQACQAAAVWLLARKDGSAVQEGALAAEKVLYRSARNKSQYSESDRDFVHFLEMPTFFSELRRRHELRAKIWPEPSFEDLKKGVLRQELSSRMLATAARLGHSFIDLYGMVIRQLGTLDIGAARGDGDEPATTDRERVEGFLDILEKQSKTPVAERGWRAFDELSATGLNYDLIIDTNLPDLKRNSVGAATVVLGRLLGQQQPTGGMSGTVNQTLVNQFRMPGYPLVLITTDLLQEGEDLHTFCSRVYHYGIAWTSSAMEQRTGRIDRVRSSAERRLTSLSRPPAGEDLLQVHLPHLQGTVEVLQVRKVLARMNRFIRLMHEGLTRPDEEDRAVDISADILTDLGYPEAITEELVTAFPVQEHFLHHPIRRQPDTAREALARFDSIARALEQNEEVDVVWEESEKPGHRLGTVRGLRNERQQPFGLFFESYHQRYLIRCVSPVGRIEIEESAEGLQQAQSGSTAQLGATLSGEKTYDLTVEDDVILGEPEKDFHRVRWLINQVVTEADRIERERLEADAPIDEFKADLGKERGRVS
ncbi:MAG: hypothetical protein RJA70_2664 [Pseudomonadota bacterium]|jgi:hypothetical protein